MTIASKAFAVTIVLGLSLMTPYQASFAAAFYAQETAAISQETTATRDPEALEDAALEAKARAIMLGIRCLVCQNQSIIDSNADLAKDLRVIVRRLVTEGKDKAAVEAYLVDRYGDWVLLNPPVDPRTWILWASPLLLLVFGGSLWLRRRRAQETTASASDPAPAPLTDAEQARLKALLDEDSAA